MENFLLQVLARNLYMFLLLGWVVDLKTSMFNFIFSASVFHPEPLGSRFDCP